MIELDNKELLEIGLHITDEVSCHVKKLLSKNIKLHTHFDRVNSSGDKITLFDQEVNERIITILKNLPQIHPLIIISEETGVEVIGSGNPYYFVVLDPVDGSNNIRPFFTPSPNIAMSIAVGYFRDLYERPLTEAIRVSVHREIFGQRVFYGLTGQGAFFTDGSITWPIKASPINSLKEKCIIGIDFDNKNEISHTLQGLVSSHIIQRRLGSSHLDLCQVACGQYDGYISDSARLKVTDVCQSHHLVNEAGGIYAYQIFYKGKAAPQYHGDYLTKVINNQSLLRDLRFKVIAAGTHELFEELSPVFKS
ncbi:inositol monophosphatase family protein [Desulfitibacter alkalitolerans]|uniref:inositol monophosphatase family protein n=1 Tax=Desulfitibacter alkalitolerans TaxID=264641 RepID=UPI000482B6C1|nr:inositol monophosphatase family protein [Desulfitibacter alkalitolerans]